jgi:IS30 family transposase
MSRRTTLGSSCSSTARIDSGSSCAAAPHGTLTPSHQYDPANHASARRADLLIGLKRSAIGTLVERTTRFTMLVYLPREEGFGVISRTKNGPALAGYGAVTMKNALAATMTKLPEQLRRSLTWDRGKEFSAHAAFRVETGIPVYFADPRSGKTIP